MCKRYEGWGGVDEGVQLACMNNVYTKLLERMGLGKQTGTGGGFCAWRFEATIHADVAVVLRKALARAGEGGEVTRSSFGTVYTFGIWF